MSCLCQYYHIPSNNIEQFVVHPLDDDQKSNEKSDQVEGNEAKESKVIDASWLAKTHAENWVLKKKLVDYEVVVESLEQLVTDVVNKQHEILGEMFRLREENRELKIRCHQQREYHTMERNALIKELHEIHTSYNKQKQLAIMQKEKIQEEESATDAEGEEEEESTSDRDSDTSDHSSTSTSGTESESEYAETEEESNESEEEEDGEDDEVDEEEDDEEEDDDDSQSYSTESESN